MALAPVRRGFGRTILAPLAVLLLVSGAVGLLAPSIRSSMQVSTDFANFESLPVRPLAMTPDGSRLLALNLPDARLEVFAIQDGTLTSEGEAQVGLDPVAVAAWDDTTAWVVNQVSDDVSILNLRTRCVIATIRVGDEPTDVVFAGSPRRAFVCVGGEDAVKIYSVTGVANVSLDMVRPIFGRHPRSLAAKDNEVYVAVRDAGNRTTALSTAEVTAGGGLPPPNPPKNQNLPSAPAVGLIVQKVGSDWVDERPASTKTWNAVIPYDLPDKDVAVLNASTGAELRTVSDVGTTLFDVAVGPVSGNLYVSNTEALNRTRFEPNLRGRFLFNRITRIEPAGTVTPWHLNTHVVYDTIPGPASEKDLSLSAPLGVAINAAETKLYVAAYGSDKVGVVDPSTGAVMNRVATSLAAKPSRNGPAGLLLDETRGQLYVLNRFSNSIALLNTANESFVTETPLAGGFDPSPPEIVAGRRFLHDATLSDHGDLSCGSCHVGGDTDHIAWDLGNPQGSLEPVPPGQLQSLPPFHPMKGPMTTQSLRGLRDASPFHWRGDRADLSRFNPAFRNLMGNEDSLSAADMQKYIDFLMTVVYPPSPNQNLNRTWPDPAAPAASATRGKNEFETKPHDGGPCTNCHTLPTGTNRLIIPGQVLQESQAFKVPQLRNMYQKTGFTDQAGAQKRGFGFLHDGSIDNLVTFLSLPVFNFANNQERRDLEAFVLSFDTGMAPSVGRQLTVNGTTKSLAGVLAVLDSLYDEADAGNCDLIAHGRIAGVVKGFVYQAGASVFRSDYDPEGTIGRDALRLSAENGGEITYLGVPPGSGVRMGIDRDRDGFRNRYEIALGADPANPASVPYVSAVESAPAPPAAILRPNRPNPFNPSTVIPFEIGRPSSVTLRIYNVSGALVRTLVEGPALPGPYEARWDGRDDDGRGVASGRYYVRLAAGSALLTRSVTLLK